jgi:hypothetical protein
MQKAKENLNLEFRTRLQEELARRMCVNERYSVRAFANYLAVDSSTLSQILSGKRLLSDSKMKEICEKIGIVTPGEARVGSSDYNLLELDSFAVISDWCHFAILDLTLLKSFKSDSSWIARKLSIQPFEASRAIERLKRLGMLIEKKGRLVKSQDFYTNYSEGVTSAALKEYQRQVIKKALQAVDNCPQERKDITSMTIAANSKRLQEAKEKIKHFRRELCAFLEEGGGDSVYHLGLQLYPVTDIEN